MTSRSRSAWLAWPTVSGGGIKSTADTSHSEIGQYFLYDIFPNTLDVFHNMQAVSGGYRPNWGGNSLPFPVQKDADGDGLVLGVDPNDNAGIPTVMVCQILLKYKPAPTHSARILTMTG